MNFIYSVVVRDIVCPSKWLLLLECKWRRKSMFPLYCVMSTAELLILTPAVNYFLAVPKMWGCLSSAFVSNLLARNTGESLKYPVNRSACVACCQVSGDVTKKMGKNIFRIIFYSCHTKTMRGVGCLAEHRDLWTFETSKEKMSFTGCFMGTWCECEMLNMVFFRCVIYALYSLLFKWKRNQSEKCMRARSPIAANGMV